MIKYIYEIVGCDVTNFSLFGKIMPIKFLNCRGRTKTLFPN